MFRILCVAVLISIGDAGTTEDARPTPRIIGGENAVIEAYPYQVSLLSTEMKLHFCGGSIISPRYIVTAAHCVNSTDSPAKVTVRTGTTWVSKGGSLHSVKKIVVHEGYSVRDDDTPLHDLALLQLDKRIRYGLKRQPIEMFKTNETAFRGAWAEVTGWGLTRKSKYKGQLQSVSIPVIVREVCDKIYSKYPGQETPAIPDGQICTGFYKVGGKDSCLGDSGGPLVIKGRLAGVVSWGAGCGTPKWPGVYTEVAYYYDWIKNQTGL